MDEGHVISNGYDYLLLDGILCFACVFPAFALICQYLSPVERDLPPTVPTPIIKIFERPPHRIGGAIHGNEH
jgi:hypothetical protein